MSKEVILKVENLSKQYRLGTLGTGTISHDLNRFLAKIRGKEDPYLKIGESNDRSSKGGSEYVWALKDINFEVKKGEVLGIIGKNGAGKSTLLKILSKVTGPTTGSIKSNGRIASLLEVGTGFHPEMTGKENIFLNGAILGMTKKEIASKLDEIVSFSGCERYIDTPVKRYSSGMKVRLAFAVAAHLEPDILIVDEVLAVGDAEFQKKAIGKMQDISNEGGRTVLFVSHNMAAVKSLCTRGVVLENGKVIFKGNSDNAVNFYLSNKKDVTKVKLSDRKDRKGSGEVQFSDIELLDENNNLVSEILSAGYAKFRLHLDFKKQIRHKDLVFGLVIYDTNEVKIADFYSDEMGGGFDEIGSHIDLEIPKLLLRGGQYNVVIVVQIKKGTVKQLDLLHDVLLFNVFPGDFWKSGVINRATNVALINAKYINKI
ncbi:ABC transporter ATP-binding protein [uncultured Polaribacter sp.]|uniref:ABC transporter ATP-binding protein n=1 Tax=uncultured Polaribacter sp. TaxID=174711 RepID=UPI0026141D25|nr:ABC transporter ATP-binding protein [uncultured Polaribacter sp.]